MWVGSSEKKGDGRRTEMTGRGSEQSKMKRFGGKRVAVPVCTIVEMFSGSR